MRPLTLAELRARLAAEGLNPGPEALWLGEETGSGSPWFVRGLVGLGAWIAGLMIAGG